MDDVLVPVLVCATLFIGMPWIILHYITKWKQAPKITQEDEGLLDELYSLARRLEDRLNTVERIVAADNPDWKPRHSQDRDRDRDRDQNDDYISRRN